MAEAKKKPAKTGKSQDVVEKVSATAKNAVKSTKDAANKVKDQVLPASKGKSKGKGKRKSLSLIVAIVLAVVVALVGTFGVLIYGFKQDSPLVYRVSTVIPYPMMRVNGEFVSYGRFLFEYNSIKQYYRSQTGSDGKPLIDFNSAEGKKKLLELRKQVQEQLERLS